MDRRNILIVEDEVHSMDMLEKLILETVPYVNCYKAYNLEQAYMILHKYVIDIFFIDIILDIKNPGDASGMNLAEELRGIEKYRYAPIIFITSLEDRNYHAHKMLHCFDYIEKPYLVNEVKKTIEDAIHYKTRLEKSRTIHFKKDGILVPIVENDIIYMKSVVRTLYIYMEYDETAIPYKTCEQIIKELDERMFVQCNRNTIVNRNYIGYVDKVNRYLEIKNCATCDRLSIGKKYLDKVLDGMKIW